ncbi:MAG: MerR family transcriptional regulator [Bdellovibrionota bacterium]
MNGRIVHRSKVPEGWLSRAKLARAAGVSRPTVKHYIDLGLLPPPVRTARNMAYYDPASVGHIRLIRELQANRHLPLEVIGRMFKSQSPETIERAYGLTRALEADLLPALAGSAGESVAREELLAIEGVDEKVLGDLERIGLIRSLPGSGGKRYDAASSKMARAVGAMRQAGFTEETGFAVADLAVYKEKIKGVVDAEIRLFLSRALPQKAGRHLPQNLQPALEGAGALVLAIRDRLLADSLSGRGTKT